MPRWRNLVYARVSGTRGSNPVEVRVLSWAPLFREAKKCPDTRITRKVMSGSGLSNYK